MKKAQLKKIVEEYLGYPIGDIKTHRDPLLPEVYAILATKGTDTYNFLLDTREGCTSEAIEECEFSEWPPKSDKSNMMKIGNVKVQ